jgi:hypothetical protein
MPGLIIHSHQGGVVPPAAPDNDWSNVAVLLDFNVDVVTNSGYWPNVTNTNFTRNTTGPIEGAGDLASAANAYLEFDLNQNHVPGPDPATGTTSPFRARDWTLEFDFTPASVPDPQTDTTERDFFTKWHEAGNDRSFRIAYRGDGTSPGDHEVIIAASDTGGGPEVESGTVNIGLLVAATAYRFAFTRTGDDVLVHLNGVYQGKVTFSAAFSFFDSIYYARFGERSDPAAGTIDGNVDQIRVTEDVARYSEGANYNTDSTRDANGRFRDHGGLVQYPRLVNFTEVSSEPAGTIHEVAYDFTPTAGNMLVVMASSDATSGGYTALPDEYATLLDNDELQVAFYIGWKEANGDEDSKSPTDVIVTNASEETAILIYEFEIPGWDGITPPEIGSVNSAQTTANAFNALTLANPSERYLILAAVARERGDTAGHWRMPGDRTWYHGRDAGFSTNVYGMACAITAVDGISSINPSGFQMSATRRYQSVLLGIKHG